MNFNNLKKAKPIWIIPKYLLDISKSIWIILSEKPCVISSLPGESENLVEIERAKAECFYRVS